MRLLHYSATPLRLERRLHRQGLDAKPHGLWVSVEGDQDWPCWCRDNDFRLNSLRYVSEVAIDPSAKILTLASLADLDAFTGRYGKSCFSTGDAIDWHLVSRQYAGIVIAPYQWARRLHWAWYYGWDCASGCIWDTFAVEASASRSCAPEPFASNSV